jgi:hypothetical protein
MSMESDSSMPKKEHELDSSQLGISQVEADSLLKESEGQQLFVTCRNYSNTKR